MRRVLSLTVMAAAVLLTGCGSTMQTPPPLQPITPGTGTGYNPSGTYTPYPGYNNGGYDPYNPYNPYPGTGAYDPNAGTIMAPLTAKIDNQKNGSFLGMGTYVVNVTVSNPASTQQTGRLKVSILNNGESLSDNTKIVTLQPGQTISLSFSDKRWVADNANVTIQTLDPSDPNYPVNSVDPSATGSYYDPNTSGYASSGYPSSGYPSSGYPTSGSYYDPNAYAGNGYASGYPSSGYTSGYPSTGYGQTGYPSTGYPSSNGTTYPY